MSEGVGRYDNRERNGSDLNRQYGTWPELVLRESP
jgi:hypothetical protein